MPAAGDGETAQTPDLGTCKQHVSVFLSHQACSYLLGQRQEADRCVLLEAIQCGGALPRQGDAGAGGQPPCLGKRVRDTGAGWRLCSSDTVIGIELVVVERSVQGSPGRAALSGGARA